jgi:hypothetical protein
MLQGRSAALPRHLARLLTFSNGFGAAADDGDQPHGAEMWPQTALLDGSSGFPCSFHAGALPHVDAASGDVPDAFWRGSQGLVAPDDVTQARLLRGRRLGVTSTRKNKGCEA